MKMSGKELFKLFMPNEEYSDIKAWDRRIIPNALYEVDGDNAKIIRNEDKQETFFSIGKRYKKPTCESCKEFCMCDGINYDCPKREVIK